MSTTIKKLVQSIGPLAGENAYRALVSLVLKVVAAVLGLATSVLLARMLGAHGYGIYAYALSWVNLLVIIVLFGMDRLAIREVAGGVAQKNWPKVKGVIGWISRSVISLCGLVCGLYLLIIGLFVYPNDSVLAINLMIACGVLPLIASTRIVESCLQGFHVIILGQIPSTILRPAAFCLMLLFLKFGYTQTAGPDDALIANLLAFIVACGVGVYWLVKSIPTQVRTATAVEHPKVWRKVSMSLLLYGGVQLVNVQVATVMLGSLSTPEAVGIYTVMLKGSELVTYPLLAMSPALGPLIARLHVEGNKARLQEVISKVSVALLFITFFVGGFIMYFSDYFLVMFGDEYLPGQPALYISCIGMIIVSTIGPMGLLLTMTNHERSAAKATLLATIVNVILCAILIPTYNVIGAAIAASAAYIFMSITLAILVTKKTGITPGFFFSKQLPDAS